MHRLYEMRTKVPARLHKGALNMRYRYILFDLDGTLFDTGEGILNSFRHTFKETGVPYEEQGLLKFIGPPLYESFRTRLGKSEEEAERMKKIYRTFYRETGVYQCRPVDGAEDCLAALVRGGAKLAVATSKPEIFAHKILQRFGFEKYFSAVCGAFPDDSRAEKSEVISAALDALGAAGEREKSVMVGDRNYDVFGAAKCGIGCIGIDVCGFAEAGELEGAGALALVRSFGELLALLEKS